MPNEITISDIQSILKLAGTAGFSGDFQALGGGEVNDTYLLNCGDRKLILRVARYEDQNTLPDEAYALSLLDSSRIPKLIYFDKQQRINGRQWILESYVSGAIKERLTIEQFSNLGKLLAEVHRVQSDHKLLGLWDQLLDNCRSFGNEAKLLNHPDPVMRKIIIESKQLFQEQQKNYNAITPSLTHSDATPSNILVDGNKVGLIDWEFAKYTDPMAEFSTIYYEDMEYNQGKWRIQIRGDEKAALFSGYELAGGQIDEDRIRLWTYLDKLGAAIFLYWRIHESSRAAREDQIVQYRLDLENLILSLSKSYL